MATVYDFNVLDIDGNRVELSKYKGKVLIIVNTASKCGFTSQYDNLERIYKDYKDKNFEILAFPCNQFGEQEPGSSEEIKEFCTLNFKTSFPLFAKIDVSGNDASPLFNYLSDAAPGILGTKSIKWNFTKFLINKAGLPIKRYAPKDLPETMLPDIQKALG